MLESSEFNGKIAAFLKIPREKVANEAVLTDLVRDSFALVDLVVELQEDYGARLTQEDLKDVRTVGELFAQFAGKLKS
ncbi:MAG: acyl carrier protein [Candidatus Obscuribacterales bacterium]|nr:acyl carrier protein [Candidatus Obscuribacterales bacterium]